MNIKKLREIAEAATPGPWSRNVSPASKYTTIFAGRNTHVLHLTADNKQVEGNADFCSTFHPARVKALLDCVEALEKSCVLLESADKAGLHIDSDKKQILAWGRAAIEALEAE